MENKNPRVLIIEDQVVPAPGDPLPCPPAESDRIGFDRDSTLTN